MILPGFLCHFKVRNICGHEQPASGFYFLPLVLAFTEFLEATFFPETAEGDAFEVVLALAAAGFFEADFATEEVLEPPEIALAAGFAVFNSTAAWAAANLATGTRKGEAET